HRLFGRLRQTLPPGYGVSPKPHGLAAAPLSSCRYRHNRKFQRRWLIRGRELRCARCAGFLDSLVRSVSLVKFIEISTLKPGQHLGTNVMKPANSRRRSDLENDLKRLSGLAYHRLESSA